MLHLRAPICPQPTAAYRKARQHGTCCDCGSGQVTQLNTPLTKEGFSWVGSAQPCPGQVYMATALAATSLSST